MKRIISLGMMLKALASPISRSLLAILTLAAEPHCAGLPRIPAAAPSPAPAVPADLSPEVPDPYGFVTMKVGDYFSCDIPQDWSRDEGTGFGLSAEEKKAYGITLTAPELTTGVPAASGIPVRISLTYYAEGSLMYKNVDHYLKVFARPALGVALEGSSYGELTPVRIGGRDGTMFERDKNEYLFGGTNSGDIPPGVNVRRRLDAVPVPVKERFIVLPAKSGFFALGYSAPAERYAKYLPVFEEVARRFYPAQSTGGGAWVR